MKEKIISSYYIQHLKVKEISEQLNVTSAYITKVIKQDSRYEKEKQYRLDISKQKRRIDKNNYIKSKREQQRIDDNYRALKKQHEQASAELSKSKHLSNESYRRWNISAFISNPSKHRYEFDERLRTCS